MKQDLIRSRIISDAWDDVERKVDEVKRELVPRSELSQEQSQEGLGDIAARDMLALARKTMGDGGSAAQDKLNVEHNEISNLMGLLFNKLDALSNFHFTPRAVHDLAVSSSRSAPALEMEEVTPMVTSAATMTAPHEHYASDQNGVPTSREEMSQNERQAKRKATKRARKKQESQKGEEKKVKEKEKDRVRVENGLTVDDELRRGPKSAKAKAAALASTKIDMSRGNVRLASQSDDTRYGSSTAVFAKIQQSQQAAAAEKGSKKGKGKGKGKGDAAAAGGGGGVLGAGGASSLGEGKKKKDGRARSLKT
jgi:U3 small nucleolar ribonucleoprotein component